jgi:hypothetical protein
LELGTWSLRKALHDLLERLLAGQYLRLIQERQRLVDDAEQIDETLLVGLDVEDAGRVLAAATQDTGAKQDKVVIVSSFFGELRRLSRAK